VRVQSNTLEWLPIFLVSLWLFAIYWNELVRGRHGHCLDHRATGLFPRLHGRSGQAQHGFLIQLLALRDPGCSGRSGRSAYSLATGGL